MVDPRDRIDDYLLERLSQEESQAFEQALKADPSLREELEFRRELRLGLIRVQEEGVSLKGGEVGAQKDEIGAQENEINAQEDEIRVQIREAVGAAPKRSPVRYILVAASVVLLLGIGWWFWTLQGPQSGPELFATYYAPQLQFDQARNPDGSPTLSDTLEERYLAGDFTFLKDRLGRIPENLKDRNVQLLEAVVFIELEQDQKAEQLLSTLEKEAIGQYAEDAAWLKALLFLRNERFAEARKIMEPIGIDAGSLYQQEAIEILQQIQDR